MKASRRREIQDDADNEQPDEESEETSLMQTINETKRKRQLLADLQFRRGTDASELNTPERKLEGNVTAEESSTDLISTMSVSQTAILEQKQHKAMEEFIQQKMSPNVVTGITSETTSDAQLRSEQDLYQQLAVESKALQGSDSASGTIGEGNADQAVMLHGTGIAEVILPIQVRAEQASSLARAAEIAKKTQRSRGSSRSSVPSRFSVPKPAKAFVGNTVGTDESSATPSTQEIDSDRPGFDSLRQRPAPKRKMIPSDRASDDHLFKRFVAHQREQMR